MAPLVISADAHCPCGMDAWTRVWSWLGPVLECARCGHILGASTD